MDINEVINNRELAGEIAETLYEIKNILEMPEYFRSETEKYLMIRELFMDEEKEALSK